MNKPQLKKMQDQLAKYFDPALGQYDLEDLAKEERYPIYP